ncbi:MAG: DUF2225 domain-containing protein [Thioploca sp.]|nr:DUF2225 domain-containing protein [Thioploca sp.]
MIIKKFLLVIVSYLTLIGQSVNALTFFETEKICPLDNTKFKTNEVASYSVFGKRLDLQPLGALVAPIPLPICPNDHFVIYADKFTKAETEYLQKYIYSDEYKKLVAEGHSSYFLLAKTFEYLKKDPLEIAHTYLQASWQVEENPKRYQEYAQNSLTYFKKFLELYHKKDDTWQTSQLVAGELERRLKRFEESQQRFLQLSQLPEMKVNSITKIINYQLELLKQLDSQPHEIPHDKR